MGIEKRYWSTEEVAEHLGIKRQKLLVWIREFGIEANHRNANHQYMFDKDGIRQFELIQTFIKNVNDYNGKTRERKASNSIREISCQ